MLILGRVQRALGFQHGQQVFGAGPVAALGDVERGLRLIQFFVLPQPLLIQATNAIERFSTSANPLMIAPR